MRWNWLRDKETHRELKYYWAPGKENDADYFTKHIPPNYNQKVIQIISLRASTLPPCTPIRTRTPNGNEKGNKFDESNSRN